MSITELQPIADMRRVKFVQLDGNRFASKHVLCDYCGQIATCRLKHKKAINWEKKSLKDCTEFQPVLTFRPPLKGFDGYFNTFRLGPAWSKRLVGGVIVALFDTKNGHVFAKAKVIETFIGDKCDMALKHGKNNHLMVDHQCEDSVQDKMLKILRNAFGKLIYESHSQATVIYLELLDDPNR